LIFIFNEVPTWSDEEIMTVGFFVNNTFAGVYIKDLFAHFFFFLSKSCFIIPGLFGFALNFASLWCVSATSGTTYAGDIIVFIKGQTSILDFYNMTYLFMLLFVVVGTLSKIPIIILGSVLFEASITK
jgi:hypothetical protein